MDVGSVIGGRYRLERMLGEGGMASVWGAVDQTLDRPVALKFIYAQDPRKRERMVRNFLQEARIAAAIRHRNVVQILDFGTADDGTPYMVMERLEGQDLGDRLRQGPMQLEALVDIICRSLEGLAAVHDAGIVHRDLKPENIFLVRDRSGDYPKLLDFGISRSVDMESGRRSAVPTQQGTVVGTPHYMSPEQAMGLPDVDQRADIYSMGIILYQALTGRLPYDSQNMAEVLLLVVQLGEAPEVIELNPDVGRALSDVVKWAMCRDRAQRYDSAPEMQAALMQAMSGAMAGRTLRFGSVRPPLQLETVSGRMEPAPTMDAVAPALASQAGLAASSNRPWIWAGAALALVLLGGIGVAALAGGRNDADSAPRYIVVQGASGSGTAPAAAAEPAGAPEGEEEPTDAIEPMSMETATLTQTDRAEKVERADARSKPASSRPARRTRGAKRSRPERGDREADLAQAVARQKPALVRCFHGKTQDAPRVQIRFRVDAAGRVQQAQVLPEGVAKSEVGSCLRRIARSTRFGPQAEPLSFTVPLTVRRQ